MFRRARKEKDGGGRDKASSDVHRTPGERKRSPPASSVLSQPPSYSTITPRPPGFFLTPRALAPSIQSISPPGNPLAPLPRSAEGIEVVSSLHLSEPLQMVPQTVPITVTRPLESPPDESSYGSVSFDSITVQVDIILQRLEAFAVTRPRSRLLTAQLISIQSRLSTWARDRDIVSVDQLESMLQHLPMITQDTMLDIGKKLRQWVKSSDRAALDRRSNPPSYSQTEYFEWMLEGYDTLEMLRTVCQSLETVVPFLSNRPLGLISRPMSNILPRHVRQAQESLSGNGGQKPVPENESSSPQNKPTIQFLYSNCIEALRAVTIMSTEKDTPNVIYSRLVVWGCGIFQPSNSLDLILEKDDADSVATFKGHVIGVLADIAVILDTMLQSYDHIIDPEVHKSHYRLQACFGLFKEFSEAVMEDGPDLPEITEDGNNERLLDVCLEQLAGLVDCLFDVLPSIDRQRQIWTLDLEKRSKELAAQLAAHAARMALIETAPFPEVAQPASFAQSANVAEPPSLHHRSGSGYHSPAHSIGSDLPPSPGPETTAKASSSPKPLYRYAGDYIDTGSLPLGESSSSASGYIPSIPDELNFLEQPTESEFSRKGKQTIGNPSRPPKQRSSPLRRRLRPPSPRDPRQESLQDIVTMDLELATALRLSLVELQTRESKEKQEDQEIMAQLQEWDREIERLKTWSDVFYKNLGSDTSEGETKRLYSVFEQLAKIGGTFASAPPGGPTQSFGPKDVEGKLKIAASVMAQSGGHSIDLKIDPTWKSYKEALKAFREANDDIENLG